MTDSTNTAPSARKIEQVMTIALKAAATPLDPENTDDAALRTALESEADVDAILHRLVLAAGEAKSSGAAVKARMDDLATRNARFERQNEIYRAAIMEIMSALGIKKHVKPEYTLSIAEPRARVIITDEMALPAGYVETVRRPKTGEIGDDLKVGVVISGAELANGSPSLTIRVR